MIPPSTSPFRPGDKVVAYCRYSEGDEQGLKNQSTEEQADAIRRFCDQNGLELVKVFADPFASGRSVAKRDHYLEMLSFLLHKKKPDIQGVVLWDYERYGRNYDRAQYDAAQLRMAGYKIYSLQQPIAGNGPFDHVLESMFFASAQNQSDMISADVKRALQHNFVTHKVIPRSCIPDGWIAVPVQMGFLSDGTPRIGYKAEPDPKLIEPIREAIEARLAGLPISAIREKMPEPFADHPEKVERIMTKTLLYGSFTYGGTTIEDYCTPIIDRATFEKLQMTNAFLKRKIRRPGSGAYSENRALLSGLCWCGVCGRRVYIERRKANGKLYETYYCDDKHSNFRKAVLDNLVLDAAVDMLSGERYRSAKTAILARFREDPINNTNEVLTREISRLDSKIEAVTDAIAEAGASRALLLKLKSLEAQRDDLESRLKPDEPKKSDLSEKMDELRDSVLSVLKDEKSSTDDLRSALSLFISAVITYPDGAVCIRHTLPGIPIFGGEMSGATTAPPEGVPIHPQFEIMLRAW